MSEPTGEAEDLAPASDEELLKRIVAAGGALVTRAQQQLAASAKKVRDDSRWSAPIPIRADIQMSYLFLGGLDAFDIGAGALVQRASQQAFGAIRFQAETLMVLKWLAEAPNESERQRRAYRIVYGQLSRMEKVLREVAPRDPPAAAAAVIAQDLKRRLSQIAREDGIQGLREEPDRRHLFDKFAPQAGYTMFSTLSELGSHPGAIGHLLFALKPGTRDIEFDLGGAFLQRAYWASLSFGNLAHTVITVGESRGWQDWLQQQANEIMAPIRPVLREAQARWDGVNVEAMRGDGEAPRTKA